MDSSLRKQRFLEHEKDNKEKILFFEYNTKEKTSIVCMLLNYFDLCLFG